MSCLMTKSTKWHVLPVKIRISLGICPVWSKSSLSAWRKLGSLATNWAHSEDSDQTGRMPRLIWVFAGGTVILLALSWGSSYLLVHWYFYHSLFIYWYDWYEIDRKQYQYYIFDICRSAKNMLRCIHTKIDTCPSNVLSLVREAVWWNLGYIQNYCDIQEIISSYNNETRPGNDTQGNNATVGQCSVNQAFTCFREISVSAPDVCRFVYTFYIILPT